MTEQMTIDDFLAVKFKPCPFCGHEVNVIRGVDREVIAGIHCGRCRGFFVFNVEVTKNDTVQEQVYKWVDRWNGRDCEQRRNTNRA